MDRRGALPGERRGGRAKGTPNKRKSDKALVRLDEAESEVRAIRAEGFKIGKLGKDRLAEIDEWAFRLAKKFAPKENEKGQPFWESPGDEARFERYLKLSAECARARAAYESPRYAAIAMAHQQEDDDPYEGIDPHKKLEDLVTRFFAAKKAEEAEKMIEVRESEPVEAKPEIDDDDPADGEAVAVWSESDDDPADGEAV
jgi:hypothetical protein